MAPLFFVLLAEGSLARRRKKLKEADGHLQQIESEHGLFGAALTVADTATVEEGDSIAKADLFGKHLVEGEYIIGGAPFDPSQDNPFASYLRKLTDDLDIPGVVVVEPDDLRYGPSAEFPGYDICRDELDGIANSSQTPGGLLKPAVRGSPTFRSTDGGRRR